MRDATTKPLRQAKGSLARQGQDKFAADIVRQPVRLVAPLAELLAQLDSQDQPVLLDSSSTHTTYARYSILACRPLEVLTLDGNVLTDRDGRTLASGAEHVWAKLGERMRPVAATLPQCPYSPGWIGYIGYEVGRLIERLPGRGAADTHLPDLRLAFYDAIILHDSVDNEAWLVELKYRHATPSQAGAGAELLRRILNGAAPTSEADASKTPCLRQDPPCPPHPDKPCPDTARTDSLPAANFTPDQYRRTVARCVEYVAAGDIFQVNLSQRFEIPNAPDPRQAYRILRARNPAGYSAYIEFVRDNRPCAILSSSPELFLRVRGRKVTTRPIKGTRGRCGDEAVDAAARADLLASAKDNAELAMIVDLLRNDLGRVCRYGSVRVTEPCVLESHPTVFHLVATVNGELRDDVGPAELLRATFPGGSITGAPKIRAMEIIDEIERLARGVYTGCVGIVCADGASEWNIAIRTIIYDDGRALIQAGGGIVADSQPDEEYRETLHKARALIEAIALASGAP